MTDCEILFHVLGNANKYVYYRVQGHSCGEPPNFTCRTSLLKIQRSYSFNAVDN